MNPRLRQVKSDFPIFSAKPGLVYLDSAATSQMPRQILETISNFDALERASVHRGVYPEAEAATERFEAARASVALFIGAASSEIVFTSGTTDSLHLAAQMTAARIFEGDAIVVTAMEHHSALVPWTVIARERGAVLRTIPVDHEGRLDMSTLPMLIDERTKVVVVTAASNVLGTVNPVSEIVRAAKAVGAATIVDAAQYVSHLSLRVSDWGADFVALSGHKMYGPTGIGVLYIRQTLVDDLVPVRLGGGTIDDLQGTELVLRPAPWKFEAGTPHIAGALGLAAAIDYLQSLDMAALARHEEELTRQLIVGLLSLDDVRLFGPTNLVDRVPVVSFALPDVHPHDLATLLGRQGIAVRAGHHCSLPLVRNLDPRGVVRVSLAAYSTENDIAMLLEGIENARKTLYG